MRRGFVSYRVDPPDRSTIIGITLSVNFADRLAHTLAHNSRLLDKIYVITDPSDSATIDITSGFGGSVILSDVSRLKGAKFNKAGLIRAAQQQLHAAYPKFWLIYFDADTLLPANLYETFGRVPAWRRDTIYEMPRRIYATLEDMEQGVIQRVGVNCGFFQMYFDKSKLYQSWSETAGECDIHFRNRFAALYVVDGFCGHIGLDGQDWAGRVCFHPDQIADGVKGGLEGQAAARVDLGLTEHR